MIFLENVDLISLLAYISVLCTLVVYLGQNVTSYLRNAKVSSLTYNINIQSVLLYENIQSYESIKCLNVYQLHVFHRKKKNKKWQTKNNRAMGGIAHLSNCIEFWPRGLVCKC